jgi:hypothetical protein
MMGSILKAKGLGSRFGIWGVMFRIHNSGHRIKGSGLGLRVTSVRCRV